MTDTIRSRHALAGLSTLTFGMKAGTMTLLYDEGDFFNAPMVKVHPPTAHLAPYPARLLQVKDADKVVIAPDNDRGAAGEHYEVARADVTTWEDAPV
jgi:hypothetical protein